MLERLDCQCALIAYGLFAVGVAEQSAAYAAFIVLLYALSVRAAFALCGDFLDLDKLMVADIGVGYLNILGNDLLAVGAVYIAKAVLLKRGLNGDLLFGVDMVIRIDSAVLKAADIAHCLAGAICLAAAVVSGVLQVAAFAAFLSVVLSAVNIKRDPFIAVLKLAERRVGLAYFLSSFSVGEIILTAVAVVIGNIALFAAACRLGRIVYQVGVVGLVLIHIQLQL